MATDIASAKYGFTVVIVGIIAVVCLALVAMTRWSTAADVAAVISAAAGIIGTMVGAYFGIQLGASGKQKAEEQRDRAEARTLAVAASLPQGELEKIRIGNPELFKTK